MIDGDWQYFSGFALAFFVAAIVVFIDCSQILQKKLIRLPINLLRSWPMLALAFACGFVAAACYACSYSEWMRQIVEIKSHNPLARGAIVGIAVLTILRSKFFNLKDQGFGGELLYNLGRTWAIESVWRKWVAKKNLIVSDELITAAITLGNFEDEVAASVKEVLPWLPQKTFTGLKSNSRTSGADAQRALLTPPATVGSSITRP